MDTSSMDLPKDREEISGKFANFCIVHSGAFKNVGDKVYYASGQYAYHYNVLTDHLTFESLKEKAKSLSQRSVSSLYFSMTVNFLDLGLVNIFSEAKVVEMLKHAIANPFSPVEIYVDHAIANDETVNEGLQNEVVTGGVEKVVQGEANETDAFDSYNRDVIEEGDSRVVGTNARDASKVINKIENENDAKYLYMSESDDSVGSLDHINPNEEVAGIRVRVREHKKQNIDVTKYFDMLFESNAKSKGKGKKKSGQVKKNRRKKQKDGEGNSQVHVTVPRDDYLHALRDCEGEMSLDGYHSEYLPSDEHDSDSSEDPDVDIETDQRQKNIKWPIFNPKIEWKMVDFSKGMQFTNVYELRHACVSYSAAKGYPIWFWKSEKERLIAKCADGCPWYLRATPSNDRRCLQIKSYKEVHTCIKDFKVKIVKSRWISKMLAADIRKNPRWKIKEMKKQVLEDYSLNVTEAQCYRARQMALMEVEKALELHYGRLRDYAEEIGRTNPGSTVVVKSVKDSNPLVFERIYVYLRALKQGWLNGCRPVIGLDGCFLKTFCKGELLCAVGRDGNNEIFPICWAIVENENKSSWKWFIKLMMRDLGLTTGDGLTIISDEQKGLMIALQELMPEAETRNCARHIYANFRKKHNSNKLRALFWEAAKKGNKPEFLSVMTEIQNTSNEAYDYLMNKEPKKWCRSFFSTTSSTENVENNMSETFNGYIIEAREKPIICMLEEIRMALMQRMQKKRDALIKLTDTICPKIRAILEENKNQYRFWTVVHNGNNGFEVKNGDDGYVVSLNERTCTRRMWQLSGIPCTHGVCAVFFINDNPDKYVQHWFLKETVMKCYENYLEPLNGEKLWPKSSLPPVLPSPARRIPGRPKRCRRKEHHEDPKVPKNPHDISKAGRKMRCSNCLQYDHNKGGCKNEKYVEPEITNKRKTKCSNCGSSDHNKLKCIALPKEKEVVAPPVPRPTKKLPVKRNMVGHANQNKKRIPQGFGVYHDENGGVHYMGHNGRPLPQNSQPQNAQHDRTATARVPPNVIESNPPHVNKPPLAAAIVPQSFVESNPPNVNKTVLANARAPQTVMKSNPPRVSKTTFLTTLKTHVGLSKNKQAWTTTGDLEKSSLMKRLAIKAQASLMLNEAIGSNETQISSQSMSIPKKTTKMVKTEPPSPSRKSWRIRNQTATKSNDPSDPINIE